MVRKVGGFIGIDMGTTGVRAILVDEKGNVLASASESIEESFVPRESSRESEQDPNFWKKPLFEVLYRVLKEKANFELKAITVDSTSGTILPIDTHEKPLYNALLHNDMRAHKEAEYINGVTGIKVKPSFALSKILWIKNNMPELFNKTYKFIHAADYIKGLISGDFVTTDFSNAVKTGYDLKRYEWPISIERLLGIPLEKLPQVVKTGSVVSELLPSIRKTYGIKNRVSVVAGATDSTTGFYSSGAKLPGDWNTTLGTVLGIRGISERFIEDPEKLLYAHRHPEGFWLPGAASNTGGESLRLFFGKRVKEYDKKIVGLPPTSSMIYPLVRSSEKFPFMNMNARGFIEMNGCDPVQMFKGFLEGISYIERMIYEKISSVGYLIGDTIYSMGGGANSIPWLKIRSAVLKKQIARARVVDTAFGAGVIAASKTYYSSLTEAISNMVRIDQIIEPSPVEINQYELLYTRFLAECKKRGLF